MTPILIIGCGSIGERHLRCFQMTGRADVRACDPNPALRAAMRERYGVPVSASVEEALAASLPAAAVICTPAHTHLPLAIQMLDAGLHVLIEKPLAADTSDVEIARETIRRAGRHVAVAYVYRAMPWLVEARGFLHSGELGRMLHVSCVAGQHFPTFRPAYREIYYARREQGGGAIQDALTHLVNAVEWIAGPCTRVYCDAAHLALEGVTVEDAVNVTARHGAVLVNYAMTQFQAPNENTILIHCEKGSVKIEIHARHWGCMKHGGKEWNWHVTPALERDALFVAQANAFMDGMEGRPTPLATFDEAVQTLKFNLAALHSADTGQPVIIE